MKTHKLEVQGWCDGSAGGMLAAVPELGLELSEGISPSVCKADSPSSVPETHRGEVKLSLKLSCSPHPYQGVYLHNLSHTK